MEGWIIDLQIKNNRAVIWFKTVDSKVLKIEKLYQPWLYIPKSNIDDVVYLEEEDVNVIAEERRIFPFGKGRFLKLTFSSLRLYRDTVEKFKNMGVDFYDGDLLHSQKFLFKNDLIPLAKYESKNREFLYIDENYRLEPASLSVMYLSVRLWSRVLLKEFTYRFGDEKETVAGDEHFVLKELEKIIKDKDPDVLLVNMDWRDFLEMLVSRARQYNEYYAIGREKINLWKLKNPIFSSPGRLVLGYTEFENIGLAGLEERCRFSMLPPKTAYRWTAGRLVDSRQCYIAFKKGFVIPPSENLNLVVRSAWEIHLNDKGGLLQSPVTGLHGNVAVLDFESMFPNIICRFNVSYETVDLDKIESKPKGLLVDVVEPFLERRLVFKHLRNKVREPYRSWADQRQNELKLLLVSSYGFSGNNYNRFGNPLTFEWINRISRIVMEKVYEIARAKGFKIVYSDTDSIFVKKPGAEVEDFEELAKEIGEAIKLPIKVDRVYKFLVLLPMKTDRNLGGTKRYYGRLLDGSLDFKGVEIKRHDYPEYIKDFQERLADKLLKGDSIEDVYNNIKECYMMVARAIDEISEGKISAEKLVIRKVLRKNEYKVLSPHYIAALQLRLNGYNLLPGDIIEFIYINSRHRNPVMRVQAWKIYDGRRYDCEKYVQLLLDAAESILLPFGFNRARFYESEKDYLDEMLENYILNRYDF